MPIARPGGACDDARVTPSDRFAEPSALRAALAERLSAMYAQEVPAYEVLLRTTDAVNARCGDRPGATRVGAERHGAVRVGSAGEMRRLARLVAAFGMFPVGLYDLRETRAASLPIVATAFRPIDPDELEASPFRLFSSLLVPDDRRFFDAETESEIVRRVEARSLFPGGLNDLVDEIGRLGGTPDHLADELVDFTVDAFRLDRGPIDAAWHAALHAVSPVAADIAAAPSTHLNHLTPRVLDIDALYAAMDEAGIEMIDEIQGPPRWAGPTVLLRQTSFRALDEDRTMVDGSGRHFTAAVRVRFGEVEERGVALTEAGRAVVDGARAGAAEAAQRDGDEDGRTVADRVREILDRSFPQAFEELVRAGFAPAAYEPGEATPRASDSVAEHVERGALRVAPITYEDFLPASAAGIFASNLTHAGVRDASRTASAAAITRLAEAAGPVHDPYELARRQQAASLSESLAAAGVA